MVGGSRENRLLCRIHVSFHLDLSLVLVASAVLVSSERSC